MWLWMLTITSCFAVGLGLGLGLDLVSCWLVVMHTYLWYFRLSLSRSKARTKATNCTCRAKKWRGTPGAHPTFAPDWCPLLSNSFRRHCFCIVLLANFFTYLLTTTGARLRAPRRKRGIISGAVHCVRIHGSRRLGRSAQEQRYGSVSSPAASWCSCHQTSESPSSAALFFPV